MNRTSEAASLESKRNKERPRTNAISTEYRDHLHGNADAVDVVVAVDDVKDF